MDIFRSEKAPYVLALLVSLIGWHVSQIVNEISKTQAVSYSVDIDPRTRNVSALIRNVSRTKSLVDATFSLECASGEDCFEALAGEGETAVYGSLQAIPPNALSRQRREDSASSIVFTNTVAAGGHYRIVGRLAAANPNARVNFFYIPSRNAQERPLDIYIYNRDTLGGLVIEHYLTILGVSLLLCSILLVVTLFQGAKRDRPEQAGPKNAD